MAALNLQGTLPQLDGLRFIISETDLATPRVIETSISLAAFNPLLATSLFYDIKNHDQLMDEEEGT